MTTDPTQLLCPFQAAWLRDREPLAIGEKSRRIGWTWTQALGVVLDRVAGRGNYYHSSADQTASVEFVDYCSHWAGMVNEVAKVSDQVEVIDDTAISSLVMKFGNGTKIVAGSSNPKFFRSKGGTVGLDEFAFHRDGKDLFKAAHATALFWGHPLRIWSTHNGPTSYFNGMIEQARRGQLEASVHTVTIEDAVRDGIAERVRMRLEKLDHIPAPDEGYRREWIRGLRATCPDEDTWQEEYMCVPSTDGSSLLSYDLIRGCEVANLQLTEDPGELPAGRAYFAGFDVGRKKDLSVLWVLERVGDVYWTRCLRQLPRMTFSAQGDLLARLLANRSVKRLCIDSTGIGAEMAERLQQRFNRFRVEAVTFTAPVKSELAMPLKRLFEDKAVRVPATAEVREGLHKVKKTVTAAGNVRLDAERDEAGHADEFWSLGLAYHAADDVKRPLPRPAGKPAGW